MDIITFKKSLSIYNKPIQQIDLEILLADVVGKSREFILAHPEYKLTREQELKIKKFVKRRIEDEPIAYIIGHKEFYGLDFKINKSTLIPRPETELLVDEVLKYLNIQTSTHLINEVLKHLNVVDIGTGSGNIIISIAKHLQNYKSKIINYKFYGIDISKKAIGIAHCNAKKHNVNKKIKFLQGNLLEPILKNSQFESLRQTDTIHNSQLVIIANLPYLSKKIYNSCKKNVKNFEPKTALYSPRAGLAHYERLFKQLQKLLFAKYKLSATVFLEISPEQKVPIKSIIKKYFPQSKIEFKKDLTGKWRMCKFKIDNRLC